jgi:uncharacterized membrane protein YccC
VFLASYATSTLGFVAGQAAFTVTVVILFNLISPAGWQLGLVRIEDVAIGTGISLAVGLLLWPRGARGEFRRAMSELLASDGRFLDRTFAYTLQHGTQEEVLLARGHAVRAYGRAGEALDQLMREHSAHPLEPGPAAVLVTAGGHAFVAGDLLSSMAMKGYQAPGDADGLVDLQAQAQVLVATFERLAMRLDTMQPVEATAGPRAELVRDAIVRLLRTWAAGATDGHTVIAAVTLAEWLLFLSRLTAALEPPIAATIETARVPWWR